MSGPLNTNHQETGQGQKPSKGMVKMFQESIGLGKGKSLALHPHLYSGLYNRASEIKALDKILSDLKSAAIKAKQQDYQNLPVILEAIKDTFNGKPKLSWWHLFTLSIGRALSSDQNHQQNNVEECRYLKQISELLTEIIRNFRSSNSRLLLEIRLAALEVDSRLVELDKIPKDDEDPDEMFGYLCSEFKLFAQEIDRLKSSAPETWQNSPQNLLEYIKKSNQLMKILANAAETQPKTYQKFLQEPHLKNIQQGIIFLLQNAKIADVNTIAFWKMPALQELFDLTAIVPDSILAISPKYLCTLLLQLEKLFVEDTNPYKKRPAIFTSNVLFNYTQYYNEEFAKAITHFRAVIKGVKEDRAIKQYPQAHFKERFVQENDLHRICSKVRIKSSVLDGNPQLKSPSAIQQEILNRMVILSNLSQPKDLDAILKTFTEEEKEDRYFLTQEVILEQFIRWRKQGIY